MRQNLGVAKYRQRKEFVFNTHVNELVAALCPSLLSPRELAPNYPLNDARWTLMTDWVPNEVFLVQASTHFFLAVAPSR